MSSMTAKAFTDQLAMLAQESATLMDEGRQQWSVDSIVYRSALDYAHKIAITRHHAAFFRPNAYARILNECQIWLKMQRRTLAD